MTRRDLSRSEKHPLGRIGGELEVRVRTFAIRRIEPQPAEFITSERCGRKDSAVADRIVFDHQPDHAVLAHRPHTDAVGRNQKPRGQEHASVSIADSVRKDPGRMDASYYAVTVGLNTELTVRRRSPRSRDSLCFCRLC